MIFFELFWTYFKIGLFTIGGGYAMLPMVQSEVVGAKGWITEEELLNFIGIAESTPGPFAVNLATFVGNSLGGIFGGIVATVGVVLPSLIIIIIVAFIIDKFIKNKGVQGFFFGVSPVVVGLIASSALGIFLQIVLPNLNLQGFASIDFSSFDWISLILIGAMFAFSQIKYKKTIESTNEQGEVSQKVITKKLHPIIMICVSAVAGIIIFGVFA